MVAGLNVPELLALLTADDVHQEPGTGKHTILGTYNDICVPSFPWTQPTFVVFLAFTDFRGKVRLELRLIDKEQLLPPVMRSEIDVVSANPAKVLELPFYGTNLVFPKPDEYRLQVFAFGHLLGEKRLIVWRESKNGRIV
jgi:hypothetical protein